MRFLITSFIGMATTAMLAQCPFTPTVSPDNVILCPGDTAVLTTEAYDAYQWYKDETAIPGATHQTLTVHQAADAGSSFTVSATLDGCTAAAAAVLVDGWVFLPPSVIHGGDEPISSGPEVQFCEGDTLTLTLSPGYTQHIAWMRNGAVMPGETSPTLVITTSGTYTAQAAPATCPNSVMGIGVDIDVQFLPMARPEIIPMGDQICVYPTGNSTQWYLAGQPLATTNCITPLSSGPYTAVVDYGLPCQGPSDPWLAFGIGPVAPKQPAIAPNPATDQLTITWPAALVPGSRWLLLDMVGRPVLSGSIPASREQEIGMKNLPAGNYVLAAQDRSWPPVKVVLVH
ncbi:MAG: hypothetical protein JSS84_11650 [Bacteroidetes bacterium]|nr:hypothetical protein [Bacteroidota bacterium]